MPIFRRPRRPVFRHHIFSLALNPFRRDALLRVGERQPSLAKTRVQVVLKLILFRVTCTWPARLRPDVNTETEHEASQRCHLQPDHDDWRSSPPFTGSSRYALQTDSPGSNSVFQNRQRLSFSQGCNRKVDGRPTENRTADPRSRFTAL